MGHARAQAAVELIIILAVTLLFLAALVYLGNAQVTSSQNSMRVAQAEASLNELSIAASQVYFEGPGARREVRVVIPDGADPARIFIAGDFINIGVATSNGLTDVNVKCDVPVRGTLPTSPGEHPVPVTAHNGYVLIGEQTLAVSPSLVYEQISTNNASTRAILLANSGPSAITVTIINGFSSTGASVSVAPTSFALPAGATQEATISIASGALPGVYSGAIIVRASNGEETPIDLVVDVVSP